jgi:hypothetical protein
MSGPYDPLEFPTDEARKLVGVTSIAAAGERVRLLGALEQVLPVTFQARAPTELDGLDGLVMLCEYKPEALLGSAASLVGCPTLMLHQAWGAVEPETRMVQVTHDAQLARPLRGRLLSEDCVGRVCSEQPSDRDSVLATIAGTPVWWSSQNVRAWAHFSAFLPQELGERESLREHLRLGRFMGLLPLLHFLWRLCGELDVGERPLRAAFVIDDPNLHRASYGYLDYARLAAEATRHAYHVAFATVPLDGWLVSSPAARLLRESSSALSLLMHGNDHTTEELGRLTDERKAQIVLAQALRRVQALERRSGVRVERVMVPPHEVCATMALRTMFRLGYEAACIGRGHPWIKSQSTSPLSWPLVKWFPTDIVDGGLPIIPRYPLDRSWGDLVFRALLGQPLILFAHHWDFADGLDVLARAAEYIDGLGDVQWTSIGSIARQSYLVRRHADRLVVDMYSRRVRIEVPYGVSFVEVRTPRMSDGERTRYLLWDDARCQMLSAGNGRDGWTSGPRSAISGKSLELMLASERPVDPSETAGARCTPWPLMRRALVEGRDSLEPVSRRLRRR